MKFDEDNKSNNIIVTNTIISYKFISEITTSAYIHLRVTMALTVYPPASSPASAYLRYLRLSTMNIASDDKHPYIWQTLLNVKVRSKLSTYGHCPCLVNPKQGEKVILSSLF